MSHPKQTPEQGEQLSDRLREIADEKKTAWPEDEYVPRENDRDRDEAAAAAAQGAMLAGGAGGMR